VPKNNFIYTVCLSSENLPNCLTFQGHLINIAFSIQ